MLGPASGPGAVAACVQSHGDRVVGFVKLLAVEPAAQGRGLGRSLLTAAASWAADTHGATEMRVGGQAPFYLWPGVDFRATKALCLFEAAGYLQTGAEFNMTCPTTFRGPSPASPAPAGPSPASPAPAGPAAAGPASAAGLAVDRVLEDRDADAVLELVAREWPWWVAETSRALEHGSCFAGMVDSTPVAFGCHSVNRAGWIGPMGTDPTRRHAGAGAAVLGGLCRDLMAAGFTEAEIAWVGPAGFYARTAGASVSRVFRTLTLRL